MGYQGRNHNVIKTQVGKGRSSCLGPVSDGHGYHQVGDVGVAHNAQSMSYDIKTW